MDPLKVKPKRDFCSVKADPRKDAVGGIFLPVHETGVEKVTERAGTILRVGPGKGEQLGLQAGNRIVYRGFLKHANPIETDDGSECFLMSVDDVLAVLPEASIEVGCFSGRPQNPQA
jgi:co-chaperonin GroES (HSP10)